MSCCGNRYAGPQGRAASFGPPARSPSTGAPVDPLFEYVGRTSLTVTGPVTGRHYRFEGTGARHVVSRHDAPSLLYVPNLKQIRRA
jgi:hypothetical protein